MTTVTPRVNETMKIASQDVSGPILESLKLQLQGHMQEGADGAGAPEMLNILGVFSCLV